MRLHARALLSGFVVILNNEHYIIIFSFFLFYSYRIPLAHFDFYAAPLPSLIYTRELRLYMHLLFVYLASERKKTVHKAHVIPIIEEKKKNNEKQTKKLNN